MSMPWERYDGDYTSGWDKPKPKKAAKKATPKTPKPKKIRKPRKSS
ncbi:MULTISPECIES: hypothetical protein [Streptomyces]|nr:hypothetical protein [Streptomyces europaeiscabiei]MDX3867278.1 hypothetical protein [Streptomyces europaeiscabiei]